MEVGWLQRMEECDRAWGREVARNLDKQAERAMKTAGKHFSAKADELEHRIEEFKRQQEAPSFVRGGGVSEVCVCRSSHCPPDPCSPHHGDVFDVIGRLHCRWTGATRFVGRGVGAAVPTRSS